ncbi:MAG TPA: hypothetical protein ENK44_15925 [Caldithrix abyssi]|uniref:Uncharacterized protein n=1 Tax=Caldithrix abyssi TaxID=187145 RepID=A0A7V4WX31_CALAY|nr:hypothetical protein [Caldithrix abyssi]
MKHFYFIVLSIILFSGSGLFGQDISTFFDEERNSVNGGLGITWIDGNPYTTFTLAPEFSFGKFGIGLFIQLLYDNFNGFKFRTAGWEGKGGYWRMINYIRYGFKGDSFYTRIGTLQGTWLGNGFIMGYYSNGVDYDNRYIGLILDADLGWMGFETMTNRLRVLDIVGARLYFRPLRGSGIPILRSLEIGGTYVTDVDPDDNNATDDRLQEWGTDLTLPIVQRDYFNLGLYADYAQIVNYGHGTAVGIRAGIPNFIGVLGLMAKLEKRWTGDQFIANYFNALYELERRPLSSTHYYPDMVPAETWTKQDFLKTVRGNSGIYGELAGHILGQIRLLGSFQYTDGIKYSGILHLEALTKDIIPSFRFRYTYDKVGIESFSDVFTLDYRSVAVGEIMYRTYQFVYVTLRYRWNFVFDPVSGEYKPQERFEPSVSFIMDF